MADLTSRPYKPNPEMCCEACVFGRGAHAEWCLRAALAEYSAMSREREKHRITEPRCPECGGNCAPECGRHPMGCVYGGFSDGYWLVTEGCPLEHK